MDDGNLIYKTLDGRNGLAEHAPYDCIHIGAAVKEIPRNILQQLSSGGRLVPFLIFFQITNLSFRSSQSSEEATNLWRASTKTQMEASRSKPFSKFAIPLFKMHKNRETLPKATTLGCRSRNRGSGAILRMSIGTRSLRMLSRTLWCLKVSKSQ